MSNLAKSNNLLRGIWIIFSREFQAYFDTPIAYVTSLVFLLLSGSFFMNEFFLTGLVDMDAYFELLPLLLTAFIPALTMRIWSEERSQFTFELLMTLPLHPFQVLLGKFFAVFSVYILILSGSLPIVLMLTTLGRPDMALIASSYGGAILLGAFFLAFGMFASGLVKDQIVAFVLAVLIGSIFVLSGLPQVVEVLDGLSPVRQIGTWLSDSISVIPHYNSFRRGLIRLSDVFYFGIMTVFFIWMNEISLRRSKY